MITITDTGSDNTIDIDPALKESSSGQIIVTGDRNRLKIGGGCRSTGKLNIQLHGGANVEFGKRCILGNLLVWATVRTVLTVGENCGFNGRISLLLHEPASISIGSRCLFGGGVDVTVSDMHSIINVVSVCP